MNRRGKIGRTLICCTLIVVLTVPGFAVEANPVLDGATVEALQEMGFPENIIEIMPTEDIARYISMYNEDPSKITVQTTTLYVDPMEELTSYITASHEEKIAAGLTETEISQTDARICEMSMMSDRELLELGIPSKDLPVYKSVLQNSQSSLPSIQPYGEGDVTPAELTLTLTTYDLSTSSGPHYGIAIYFDWSQIFLLNGLTDKMVVGWGGNLVVDRNETVGTVVYRYAGNTWGAVADSSSVSYSEAMDNIDNGSGWFSFSQGDALKGTKVKSGNFHLDLVQNGYENKMANVVVQYAHQIVGVTGVSITFTFPPSKDHIFDVEIEIGSAYDTSDQVSKLIDI